jgi:hypothetical protein
MATLLGIVTRLVTQIRKWSTDPPTDKALTCRFARRGGGRGCGIRAVRSLTATAMVTAAVAAGVVAGNTGPRCCDHGRERPPTGYGLSAPPRLMTQQNKPGVVPDIAMPWCFSLGRPCLALALATRTYCRRWVSC